MEQNNRMNPCEPACTTANGGMKRRTFLQTGAVGMSALAVSPLAASASVPNDRPNIVLIMADDLGYECLSCNGSTDYHTPNLDRLAQTGIRYTQCYSQPLCTPSRVQIMTGRYNHRNYEGFGYLNPREITFANLLLDAGYRTCVAGKWQLSGDAGTVQRFGFEEHCLWNMHAYKRDTPDAPEPARARNRYSSPVLYRNGEWHEYGEDAYGPDVCCEFLCSFMEQHKNEPFLAYYPMILTHSPFVPTPDSTDSQETGEKKNFRDMVQYTDNLVGRIIDCLERLGLLENTLLLFTGDNGTHTSITSNTVYGKIPGGKSRTTDAGTHVPLIANWPERTPKGIVSEALIDFSDFLPTLAELTGARLPDDRTIDGLSFAAHLQGRESLSREWVFCHYWGARGRKREGTEEFARDQRWKLYGDGRLYDTRSDPHEANALQQLSEEAQAAKLRLEKAIEEMKLR